MKTPWIRDILYTPFDAPFETLTLEKFRAKYFPQWEWPWQADYRIRIRKDGWPVDSGRKGVHQAQETKRQNTLQRAYDHYLAIAREEQRRREAYVQPEMNL